MADFNYCYGTDMNPGVGYFEHAPRQGPSSEAGYFNQPSHHHDQYIANYSTNQNTGYSYQPEYYEQPPKPAPCSINVPEVNYEHVPSNFSVPPPPVYSFPTSSYDSTQDPFKPRNENFQYANFDVGASAYAGISSRESYASNNTKPAVRDFIVPGPDLSNPPPKSLSSVPQNANYRRDWNYSESLNKDVTSQKRTEAIKLDSDLGICSKESCASKSIHDVAPYTCARLQEEFIIKCIVDRPRRKPSPSSSAKSECRNLSPPRRPRNTNKCVSKSVKSQRKRSISRELRRSPIKKQSSFIGKWRRNSSASNKEMKDKLEEISNMKPENIVKNEKLFCTRSAPAELYYLKNNDTGSLEATDKLISLCDQFEEELVKRGQRARAEKPNFYFTSKNKRICKQKCCILKNDFSSESCEDEGLFLEELKRKKSHPDGLHPEFWYNDPGEMNIGPFCRCSAEARRSGIRHNIYAGEESLNKCDIYSNNSDRLYHYRITISPPTNFIVNTPTVIEHDHHEFIFEGFSMFSHKPLENLPICKVSRYTIEYTILYVEENVPQRFVIRELDLFHEFIFKEILELLDLDFKAPGDASGCSQFHFMPRFVQKLPKNEKELLSMSFVMKYLLECSKPLIPKEKLSEIVALPYRPWQKLVDEVTGMIVTFPGKKPCSVRVDQLDRDHSNPLNGQVKFPEIVHFGIRSSQLSYAGNPKYHKAWRECIEFRHLLANMPKPSYEDKSKLEAMENRLYEMRTQDKIKRIVRIAVSSKGFYRTGIMCDIVQHAMLLPVLVSHLRFHRSLDVLENKIQYKFKNRSLLQLALTHPSCTKKFGTNPDHARNALANCGIRQPKCGDRKIHYMKTRRRGINTLISIMSRFGKNMETESNITQNERLEFLGDAVVELVTSIHLFHLFPRLEEGPLTVYRSAIVSNQHLAVLAKTIELDSYMLYAHVPDVYHDSDLKLAMANCFEALMGALFLDGGIDAADKVFGVVLFEDEEILLNIWKNYPPHPLQEAEPGGDRKWIEKYERLKRLTKFENSIGIKFTHIRLLACAFTDRTFGYTNLTLGSNQRLEFLGDAVLQLIASEYLYKFFPEHHEGHLSLLRRSLLNNRNQAVVFDDLGMSAYAEYTDPKTVLKTKDRADFLGAFLGALFLDKGIIYCQAFCGVCFFPRLNDFITHQDWYDPIPKLQQCCLAFRTMDGDESETPVYKVIQYEGPPSERLHTVAVYFKGKRLAQATGFTVHQAKINAAKVALDNSQNLFPQSGNQKRVTAKSIKHAKEALLNIKREISPSSVKFRPKKVKYSDVEDFIMKGPEQDFLTESKESLKNQLTYEQRPRCSSESSSSSVKRRLSQKAKHPIPTSIEQT